MNHKRKLNLKKQLACIYTADLFSGLRITDAVWVALLAARGFSLWEIGLAESVFHVVSLLCEVPSGMAADLLGRKKTLVSGGVCMVLQSLLMAFASDLFTICFAMGLNALAMTMFSGTSTALLYDSLKQEGCEEEYIQVSANGSQISMLANAIGSMASILNQFLGYAGFYLLNAAFEGASALANMLLAEPIVTESQASREKHPLHALPKQFRQLVRDSLHVLRTCPMAVKLIASSALISVPSYLTKMFLQQRLVGLAHGAALPSPAAGRSGLRGGHRDRPPGEMPLHAAALHSLCPALRCGHSAGGCCACLGRHPGHDAGAGCAGGLSAPREPEAERCHPQ